jgi:hypothetical protein
MARTVTLLQLRNDIRWQSDNVGFTARHSDADITRAINQSIQRFRLMLSQHGDRKFLVANTGTLTAGATSPYPFGVLNTSAWNPQIVRLFGFDITVQGRVIPLELVPFDMRNDFQRAETGTSANSPPVALAQFGSESYAILPASDGAYAYTAWYLPVLADLANDADTFDGVAGWEEWVKWDCVQKLNSRDTNAKAYQIAQSEQVQVWGVIAAACPTKQGGVVRRYDSRGLRSDRMALRRNWIGR